MEHSNNYGKTSRSYQCDVNVMSRYQCKRHKPSFCVTELTKTL